MQLIFLVEFRNLDRPNNHVQYDKNRIEVE